MAPYFCGALLQKSFSCVGLFANAAGGISHAKTAETLCLGRALFAVLVLASFAHMQQAEFLADGMLVAW